MHIPGCQKNGAFHIGIQKNRVIHILFVEKRGQIIYLAALKKGAIWHAHPYYAIYRKLPLPPPHTEDFSQFLHKKKQVVGTHENEYPLFCFYRDIRRISQNFHKILLNEPYAKYCYTVHVSLLLTIPLKPYLPGVGWGRG